MDNHRKFSIIIKFPHLVYQKFAEMKESYITLLCQIWIVQIQFLDYTFIVSFVSSMVELIKRNWLVLGAVARSEARPLGMQAALSSIPMSSTFFRGDLFRQKKNICVFQVSRPYLGFCPALNILLWIVSKMLSNLLEKGEKYIKKCNFFIKYFDKIKCYADRPYWVFFRAEIWNTHIVFFGLMQTFLWPFSLFCWFKKSSCQLMAKECALSTGKLPRRFAQEQCG